MRHWQHTMCRSGRMTAVALVGLCFSVGCASTGDKRTPTDSQTGHVDSTAGTQSGQDGYLNSQAGGMAAEDARRTRTATSPQGQARPEPIRSERRSPVDQPRFR